MDDMQLRIHCEKCCRLIDGATIYWFLKKAKREPRICGICIVQAFDELFYEAGEKPFGTLPYKEEDGDESK